MATLPLSSARAIRNYEPVFRSMLRRWLEAHIDATGNAALTLDDVSAGVAHTFSAIQSGFKIALGSVEQSQQDLQAGRVIGITEARNELCGQVLS